MKGTATIRAIYVEQDIPRILAVKVLRRLWPDVVSSPLSPVEHLPGSRWVRVRNRQCGICASDLTLVFADVDLSVSPAALPRPYRLYLGHEVVGEVIEIGPAVTRVQVGDRVTTDSRFSMAVLPRSPEPAWIAADSTT